MKYFKYHEKIYQKLEKTGKKKMHNLSTFHIKPFLDILRFYPVSRNTKVLELGCGTGDISFAFARRGFAVTGIDISPSAIKIARSRAKERGLKVKFAVGDVTKLKGFQNNFYDLVIDGHCLHCIVWKDERQEFLKNSFRLLKAGGYLLVNTMVMSPQKYLDKYENEFILKKKGTGPINFYDVGDKN